MKIIVWEGQYLSRLGRSNLAMAVYVRSLRIGGDADLKQSLARYWKGEGQRLLRVASSGTDREVKEELKRH